MKAKSIIIVQTPVHFKVFTQVTCLMDEDELAQAKKERPDLIFQLASKLPDIVQEEVESRLPLVEAVEDETKGITVKGMTLPANLDYLINKVLEKE